MTPIITARACAHDSSSLAPLFDEYRGFYGRIRNPQGAEEFLRQRLERQDSTVIFASVGVEPLLGFVQLYGSFSSLNLQPTLILNDLYIRPEVRRRGIARLLLREARCLGQERGAVSIQLETAISNAEARALYESEGYRLEQDFVQYALKL